MISHQHAMPHDDPHCSTILHRENSLDIPPIGGEPDVTAFARNNSLTSQQLRYRSQSSASSQGSFVDPEGSVGFHKDLAQIVTCDTTAKEDNKMEGFHPQQRRETGGNAKMLIQDGSVNMPDFLRIPKKNQGETLDSKCDDSRHLSQNSTDSDFYGSSHCSSHGSSHGEMESFQPQQRRETGENAKMLTQDGSVNILRIPRNPPSNFDS